MMELKKFEAPTLAEALQVIKRELGPEAIILSTKNKKSSLGLLNRTSVEVTAAVAPEALERKRSAEGRMTQDQIADMSARPAGRAAKAYDVLSGSRLTRMARAENALETLTQKAPARAAARSNTGSAFGSPMPTQAPKPAITQRRYVDITDDESPAEQVTARSVDRSSFAKPSAHSTPQYATHQSPFAMAAAPAMAALNAAAHVSTAPSGAQIPGLLQKILAQVIEAGVEADLVRSLADELKATMLREHISREDLLRLRFAKILMSRLRVARPLSERLRMPTNPRVIAFVGPTGVGKTTTIAKIAAEIVIHQKRPVTLATTDTYKIAAVEQLQTYANILKVPLEVCGSAEALGNVSTQLGGDEVLLVDTAGYGPRDEKRLHETKEVLEGIRCETHLCVSAMTRDRDLTEIVRRFKLFAPDYLVVTKLDETSAYGNIFNVGASSLVPLSYFTMGQRVPEDIEVATRERLADLILNISGGDPSWTKQIG